MDQDADFPWAVDIPIPPVGLGQLLPVVLDAAKACAGGARVTAHGEPEHAEVRHWFNRVATRNSADAERLALTFRSIGARQVR